MEEIVMKIIVNISADSCESENYKENIHLDVDYGFDSLMIIEFITAVEDEFGFEFDFDEFDIEEIYNLDKLLDFIKLNAI